MKHIVKPISLLGALLISASISVGCSRKLLLERGFHEPGDVENRLGYQVGQLAVAD
jgi:hypothetical protein